jgi:acyl carrier protein
VETILTNQVDAQNENGLIQEIKKLIVNAVGLQRTNLADLTAETSLKTGGLELDSVDILEVVVMIEQRFGVKVTDSETGVQAFRTIGTIAEFITREKLLPKA